MATYKDGLKAMLASDRYTTRVTPFRRAMLARMKERARRGDEFSPGPRFARPTSAALREATGAERVSLMRQYYESYRFQTYQKGKRMREPHAERIGGMRDWPGYLPAEAWGKKVPRYRSGIEKRKI